MKGKLLSSFILTCLIVFTGSLTFGQRRTIKGEVKDLSGPLSGVSVVQKDNTKNGVLTNDKGEFTISLSGGSPILVFSSVGHLKQELSSEGKSFLDVTMELQTMSLRQVEVVGYTKVTRITSTGAVSTINAEEVSRIPTANVQNTLAGKLPGFFSVQRSGQPGFDGADFFIRGVSSLNADGNRPLIIVDDIQYDYDQLSQINVNDIQSISIIKDASTTALYGIKGANGVLVVTTKRGVAGLPKFNVRTEGSFQTPTKTPKFLNSYQVAQLRNEALSNDGLLPQFTQKDIELFKNGSDPYGHPDVDWYKVLFRDVATQSNTNIDVSGGTETVKYFISGGYLFQNGLLRDFVKQSQSEYNSQYNNNYFLRRYNFRTNLDVQASKNLQLRMDLTGRFGVVNQPVGRGRGSNTNSSDLINYIYNYAAITPFAAPVLNPDGSFAYTTGTVTNAPTMNALIGTQGYDRSTRTDFNIVFGGNEKMDFITKGLAFKAQVAYASIQNAGRRLIRIVNPPAFHFNPEDSSYTNLNNVFRLNKFRLQPSNSLFNATINWQAFLTYDRTFGSNEISGLLLYNNDSRVSNADVPVRSRGFSTRISYNFAKRYLIDLDIGYNGTDRFAQKNRYNLFPALSVGWNMAKEPFFKDVFPVFDLFKIRASYGEVGSDVVSGDRYLYEQTYDRTGSYYFGPNASARSAIIEGTLGNEDVSWEIGKKTDIGLDVNLVNGKLSFTIDYFNDLRVNQLITPASVSAVLGIGLPPVNLGRVRNRGFDGQVAWESYAGQLRYSINYVFSFAKNKILFMDEPEPRYPWLSQTGHSIGQLYGYTWIGYYENDVDIAKSAKPNLPNIQPGDLKYKDLNGDGVIDDNDKSAVGYPNLPNSTMGLTLGLAYKGFYLSTLFQTAFNYSFRVTGSGIEPFQSNLQPIHLERWTPENAENAQFPRLTTLSNTINSAASFPSDFWLVNAAYVRLKQIELGYQFSNRKLPLDVDNIRLYMSAYNLFTWSNVGLYQQDPEIGSGGLGDAYPNMAVINLGIQITF